MPYAARAAALAAALAALLVAASGAEPAKEPPAKNVRVSVVAIVATGRDGEMDPRLADVAREVQFNVDPRLTGFRVARSTCKSLRPGACDTFPLVGDQTVTVRVLTPVDAQGRVQLKVSPPLLGEITYSAACDAFLPIVTRYRLPNGDLLIVAVRVCPCHGK